MCTACFRKQFVTADNLHRLCIKRCEHDIRRRRSSICTNKYVRLLYSLQKHLLKCVFCFCTFITKTNLEYYNLLYAFIIIRYAPKSLRFSTECILLKSLAEKRGFHAITRKSFLCNQEIKQHNRMT